MEYDAALMCSILNYTAVFETGKVPSYWPLYRKENTACEQICNNNQIIIHQI